MLSIKDFQLRILSGRCSKNFEFVSFHNEVYEFWKAFWNDVFQQNGTNSKADANIFYRQNLVAVLTKNEKIVGTIFHSENNIQSTVVREISYFDRPYIREICNRWASENCHDVSTYEMLTVNPQFRKKETGISFGSILLGVAVKAFLQSEDRVMIGPVRLDNGVDKMVEDFGWQLISDPYLMHGTPVAVSALFRENVRSNPDSEIQNWIESLWNNRMDLRYPKISNTSEMKIAA